MIQEYDKLIIPEDIQKMSLEEIHKKREEIEKELEITYGKNRKDNTHSRRCNSLFLL